MRKRERGGCEKGGGEANGGTGRVEQMGEKESERERERESAHTPLSALSVDRLILTWLEWVCCGVLIDEEHRDTQDYVQYLEKALPVWNALGDTQIADVRILYWVTKTDLGFTCEVCHTNSCISMLFTVFQRCLCN